MKTVNDPVSFKGLASNIGIVTVGNGLGALLGFTSLVVVARTMPQSEFGLFSLLIIMMTMIVSVTDFGIPITAVRFSAPLVENNPKKAAAFLQTAFIIRFIVSVIVALAGLLFAPSIAKLLTGDENLAGVVRLAFLGTLLMSIGIFGNSIFQAWQQYVRLAIYSIFSNLSRLITILIISAAGYLSIRSGVIAYSLAPLIGMIMIISIGKQYLFHRASKKYRAVTFSKIAGFNKWLAIAFACDALTTRVNVLVLAHFRETEQVAIFAVAMQVSLAIPIILFSFISVLIPQASQLNTYYELKMYLKKSVTISTGVSSLFIPVIIFSDSIVQIIYGHQYAESGQVLRIMLLTFTISFIVYPIYTVLFPMNKTRTIAILAIPHLAGMIIITYLLVPELGALGAAYAYLMVSASWSIVMVITVMFYIMNIRHQDTIVVKSVRRDRKSTRLNSSHIPLSRMPSSA